MRGPYSEKGRGNGGGEVRKRGGGGGGREETVLIGVFFRVGQKCRTRPLPTFSSPPSKDLEALEVRGKENIAVD